MITETLTIYLPANPKLAPPQGKSLINRLLTAETKCAIVLKFVSDEKWKEMTS